MTPVRPWCPTATEAAAALRTGETTSTALVRAALERIDAVDSALGAFRVVLADQALGAAARADAELREGRDLGPLHGLPVAVKDVIDVRGVPTTGSCPAYADRAEAAADAACVARLRAEGAVVLGKTETHELALGVVTPTTRNGRDVARIPGGSSGGSGAAVAAGIVPLALGTDTGGSVRIPASLCGVVGLKPTFGRISTRGLLPTAWSYDTVGPLTRSVRDAAVALMVLAGHDPGHRGSLDEPLESPLASLDAGVDGMTVGLATGFFATRVQPDVAAAVRRAAEVLERAGASVREVELSGAAYRTAFSLAQPEAATAHGWILRDRAHLVQPETRRFLERGSDVLATSYIAAQRARARVVEHWRERFEGLDAMLLATTPATATAVGETEVEWDDGATEGLSSCFGRFTRAANLTGQPALSLPCGVDRHGLPIGLQVMGRPLDEATVLRIGYAYEQSAGGYCTQPPPAAIRARSQT